MTDPYDRDLHDALYGERAEHVARDSNPESEVEQFDRYLSGSRFEDRISRTFATMPPPFPTDRHRPRTRSSAARSNNGQTQNDPMVLTRAQYWRNHRPTLKAKAWASVTVHLPLLPPASETTEIKNTILHSFTQRLQDADGDWTDKTSLFISEFEHLVPAASLEADVVLTDFTNYSSNVFDFESYECYNSMYEPVALTNLAQFQPNERSVIRWFKFALTIAPQEMNVGHLEVDANLFPSRQTHTVFVRALLNANGALHQSLTKNILRTRASTLKDLYSAQGQTLEPAVKSSESSYADPAKFLRILREIKAETKFAAIKQIVTPVFVGRIDGLRSLTNRILAVEQNFYDPVAQTRRFSTVPEMNQKMQALLQEIDHDNPPADLPDLAKTFFQGLHENLKHKIIDDLPAGTPTSLGQNLRRYNDVVRQAIEAEEEQKRVAKTIHQIATKLAPGRPQTRSQNRSSGPRVFFASQNTDYDDPPQPYEQTDPRTFAATRRPQEHTTDQDVANTWLTTPSGITFKIPRCFCSTHTGNRVAEEMIAASVEMVETLTDEPADGFAGVSIVEQALRNASRVRKPLKCFGCQGLSQYDNNAYHLWKDCPNKSDQAVWRNFQQNLRRFREEKNRRREENRSNNNYYEPHRDTPKETAEPTEAASSANWQRQGFPTRAMGEKIEAIADPETKPAVRRALLATLKKELIDTDLTESEENDHTTKPKSKKKKRGPVFLLYMKSDKKKVPTPTNPTQPATNTPRTLVAASQGKYPLRIAYNLPHLRFPIGDGQTATDKAYITGLLDTGGCCMMGKLEWYTELHRVCPQLFDDFFELADRRYENINIGGLKDGIWLTHVAVMWIPYEERGATMRIEIGLSSELPLDTLFGVNFQKATKMTINLGSNKAESAYLGDVYDIVWRSPTNTDIAQIQHEAQKTPMAFVTAEEVDTDEEDSE